MLQLRVFGAAPARGALVVLAVNVVMLLAGASSTLLIQRSMAARPEAG